MKYYLKRLKSDTVSFPFISVGYSKFYSTQNLTTHWFSGYKFDPSLARVNNIHVFSVNLGICNYYKRLLVESVVGTGIRFRTVQNVVTNGSTLAEGKQVLPQFSIGIRIGYIINILQTSIY